MRARFLWLAVFLPSTALADSPKKRPAFEEQARFSAPFILGVDAALTSPSTATGFYGGVRPELVFAWSKEDVRSTAGFGFGPYANFGGSTGTSQIWLGGGATAVLYVGIFGVALSGGIDCDWLRAVPNASPVVGLFAGFRPRRIDDIDFPLGLRVDFRPPLGDVPATFIVSAQVDVIGFVAVGMLMNLFHQH
ncbi:MAG TPA: hypothetical protein VGH28_29695 [Polyangiaceae bacterium]|jgi:hypothetical protein